MVTIKDEKGWAWEDMEIEGWRKEAGGHRKDLQGWVQLRLYHTQESTFSVLATRYSERVMARNRLRKVNFQETKLGRCLQVKHKAKPRQNKMEGSKWQVTLVGVGGNGLSLWFVTHVAMGD